MKERRAKERIPRRKKVKHGLSGTNFLGYTLNISENGLAIESQFVFPCNYRIVFDLYSEIGIIKLNGHVVWSIKSTPSFLPRMGIKISTSIKELIHTSDSLVISGRDILILENK
ncbi:MAG: PilZ domain-containing protein [Deltaproteobacteria bacterium]|nr:PilZ domain-containing protein [Deltaproteobacteria bacterium]